MSVSWLTRNWTEQFSRHVKQIDTQHAYIHKGIMYSVVTKKTFTTGEVYKITFETPASSSGIFVHFQPSLITTSGDKVDVHIFEGSSGDTGGTVDTPVNRNRVSNNTSEIIFKEGVTVTTNGTLIEEYYIGGGTGVGGTTQGGSIGESDELILKQGTVYTIQVTNNSSASNNIFMKFEWYEA